MGSKKDYIKMRGEQADRLKKIIDNSEKRDVNRSDFIIKEFQKKIEKFKLKLRIIKEKKSEKSKETINKAEIVWKDLITKIKTFPGFIK